MEDGGGIGRLIAQAATWANVGEAIATSEAKRFATLRLCESRSSPLHIRVRTCVHAHIHDTHIRTHTSHSFPTRLELET